MYGDDLALSFETNFTNCFKLPTGKDEVMRLVMHDMAC